MDSKDRDHRTCYQHIIWKPTFVCGFVLLHTVMTNFHISEVAIIAEWYSIMQDVEQHNGLNYPDFVTTAWLCRKSGLTMVQTCNLLKTGNVAKEGPAFWINELLNSHVFRVWEARSVADVSEPFCWSVWILTMSFDWLFGSISLTAIISCS